MYIRTQYRNITSYTSFTQYERGLLRVSQLPMRWIALKPPTGLEENADARRVPRSGRSSALGRSPNVNQAGRASYEGNRAGSSHA